MDRAEFEAAVWAALGNIPGWAAWHASHPAQGVLTVETITAAAYRYAQAEAEKAIKGDSHAVQERQRILADVAKGVRR